jgi:glycosyltransferase involved in cell wall biosynthesis
MLPNKINHRVSFFIPNFNIGGIEVSYKQLCNSLVSKVQSIELVYCEDIGPIKKDFHKDVALINLGANRMIPVIWQLKNYFEKNQPEVFITPMYMLGNAAIIARFLSKSKPKIIIGARSTFSQVTKSFDRAFDGFALHYLSKFLFKYADRIISVSNGVQSDLVEVLELNPDQVTTIYNPVIDDRHNQNHYSPPAHKWFQELDRDYKVLIAIGRLSPEKDFAGVIEAFYEIHDSFNIKLIIIGEGALKEKLLNLVTKLGLDEKIEIMNFQKNYLSYLAYADIFILNSKFEGLPGVLIEALALNCKVVSSDCNHGPREILNYGEYGILFPVGDKENLKKGIIESLNLKKTNKFNSKENIFTIHESSSRYLMEINNLLQ